MQHDNHELSAQLLEMLRAQFPDVLSITPGEALAASGFCKAKNPEHSARQAIHIGTFPFPVVRTGGTRRVLLTSIADAMARSTSSPPPDARRGSPDQSPAAGTAARCQQALS